MPSCTFSTLLNTERQHCVLSSTEPVGIASGVRCTWLKRFG